MFKNWIVVVVVSAEDAITITLLSADEQPCEGDAYTRHDALVTVPVTLKKSLKSISIDFPVSLVGTSEKLKDVTAFD